MTDTPDTPNIDEEVNDLEENALTKERLAKYRKAIEDGGFPYAFDRSHTASDLHLKYGHLEPGDETGDAVTVAGRLMNTRTMGKLAFGDI